MSIDAALFAVPPAVIVQARKLIERDTGETNPGRVEVRWLGIATALVAWIADGEAHAETFTGDDARLLHEAEGGSTSFPPICRAERQVDGQIVVCELRSPHYPKYHSDGDGNTW